MSNTPSIRRILVIDDNDAIHDDFRKTLSPRGADASLDIAEAAIFGDSTAPAPASFVYEIDSAMQGQEALEKVRSALQQGKPYWLAFVDMRMPPGWDGVETIQRLWQVDPDLQVVICTAFSDHSWEQIVAQLGQSDKLLILKKPFDGIEVCQLAVALTEKWKLARQAQSKLNELETIVADRTAELRKVALQDRLTGLPNRALFLDRLNRALERSRRSSEFKFAVLFLDFDRFKVINDSLGHEIGDLLLVEISKRLRDSLRAGDSVTGSDQPATAARLGGDEFIVLLDNLRDLQDAATVAERLQKVLSQPYDLKGHEVHTSASIGITTSAGGYARAEDMIRDADTAMYRAKSSGRAKFVIFDRQMHEQAVARLTLENDLRQAAERGEFLVHYQPIVSLNDGRLVGFEALLRWLHPTRGLVSPADFIPVAEETGLIVPIGLRVLDESCRQVMNWRVAMPAARDVSVSVNLSRKQLTSPDLVEQVRQTLVRSRLPAGALKLEITESTIMDDMDTSLRVLHALHALGISLHMDDFGTGYSSLSCLHKFPLSGLKIDRSFVSQLERGSSHASVVGAVVALAQSLKIELVAEGVETPMQAQLLRDLRCGLGQGYLFAKPMPVEQVEEFLRKPECAIAA